uniref:Uso1_p115_head domain-containing protein n=1 Tax=Heterorhabditis bacteriophora TaxID=37862 RepID=A0A1I7XR10_HETBA
MGRPWTANNIHGIAKRSRQKSPSVHLSMQNCLGGQRFRDAAELRKWIDDVIASKPMSFFHEGIRELPERWQKEMAYFRSFFGGSATEDVENGAEIVEKLVERAETCTVLEDRRDSLRALRSMAKKLRLAVGTMGMNVFTEILEERSNQEMTTLSLEILVAVLSSDDENTDDDELGERLAEVMLKKPIFIPSLLSCLEQFDFGVRRHVFVHCIIIQIFSQFNWYGTLDSTIISIVIEDCLFVILNLLRRNAMNQQLFRENNLIPRLGVVLHTFLYGTEEDQTVSCEWAKQRTANLIFLLQIIRSLVSPDNAGSNTHAAQKVLHHTKMLAELCHVLLSELGVTVEVLTETIIVVAEAIRGNYTNQEYFSSTSLSTQENSNRPSLLVLLISMTAEKQPFKLRCAVFYCFLSYLYDNEFGKTKVMRIVEFINYFIVVIEVFITFQAISSGESVQCWFGCVSLLHCLLDVEHLREQLLRVQLSTSADQPPVSLLRHISSLLVNTGNRRVQMRAGLLMLLTVWLTNCTSAVKAFVENQENLHYLTTQIVDDCGEGSESEQQVLKGLMAILLLTCLYGTQDQTTRRSLEQLVDRRVGRDHLISAVEGVSRTEQFVRAAQKPQPLAKSPNELFLDFHFIKLFKSTEGKKKKTRKLCSCQ